MTQTNENQRKIEYSRAHQTDPRAFPDLLESLELEQGQTVLDAMGGYGEVTRQILEYCKSLGIAVNPILSDLFLEQIERAPKELEGVERVVMDAREPSLANESVDRIVIKMGLHEVQKPDQYRIINGGYRILKTGGKILVWDVMPENPEEQKFFREILKKKDELSGLTRMAEERYWPREVEVVDDLEQAGFKEIKKAHASPFKVKTSNWLTSDLATNATPEEARARLQEWNNYIKRIIPKNLKAKYSFRDNKEDIELSIPNSLKIIEARK